jgi:DIM1 family U5 snRNP protein
MNPTKDHTGVVTPLSRAWDVDRFIVLEQQRLVVVLFSAFAGRPYDPAIVAASRAPGAPSGEAITPVEAAYWQETAQMEDSLIRTARVMSRYAVCYTVSTLEVPEFDVLYELHADEPFALLFFYQGKRVAVDMGTGNYNKINFAMDEDDWKDLLQAVSVGVRDGHAVVDAPKKFSEYAGRGELA